MALRSMAMADVQLQAAICSGGSWWSDARVGSSHVDDPTPVMWAPFSCSPADHLSSTADDGHFNWQPAASPEPLDETVTTSDEAAGSYNTATFYQDIEYPGDAYGSMAVVLDSCSTQVFDSDLFCTWSRPFLSTPIVDEETGVHSLIQEDIYSSRPCCPQEPGIGFGSNQIHEFVGSTDPLDHLEGIHATISNAALCSVLFPASSSLLLETSSPFSAGGWHSQLPKAMPKQQFTNVEAPVWVPCVSNAAKACSRALHQSAPTPLAVQEINVKANSGSKNSSSTCSEDIASSEPVPKKARIETPLPTFKVRKEKLGDRITLLQQLVSPFGKTDTASVLHEAIDYIKFLHDQVQVLSTSRKGQKQEATKIPNKDLRSRGLCLVPISSTVQMLAREAPVDLWPLGFGADYS